MPSPLGNYETDDEKNSSEPTESDFIEADRELQAETNQSLTIKIGLAIIIIALIGFLIVFLI